MKYFSLFSGVGGFELGIEKAYEDLSKTARQERRQSARGRAGRDGQELSGQQPRHLHREQPEEQRDHGRKKSGPAPALVGSHAVGSNDRRQEPAARGAADGQGRKPPVAPAHVAVPRCIGLSEIDRHANAVLRYRFLDVKNYGDISKIDWAGVPRFDLLVGGSPCQDLSIAGKRAGLAGGRSGLFHEYVRALKEKQPRHFIWENVKGALSSNGGRDFGAVLHALAEAGYALSWQVLNAKDFGVPQNRERIFVVGTRGGCAAEILPELEGGEEALGRIEAVDSSVPQSERVYGAEGIAPSLASSRGGGSAARPMIRWQNKKAGVVMSTQAPSLRASRGTDIRKRPVVLHENQSGTVTPHAKSDALGANRSHNYQTLLKDARIRRLTPRECERLMSWPDDWTRFGDYGDGPVEISDTQRYKMAGNGVVSNVVAEVVKNLFLTI